MHPPAVEVTVTLRMRIWVRGKIAGVALCALGTVGILTYKVISPAPPDLQKNTQTLDLHKNTQTVVKNVQITTVSPVVLINCGGPE